MSTRTILVPTDFSPASTAALPHAEALARQNDGRLVIVHVQEPPMAYGGGELPAPLPEPDSARVATMLEAVKPRDAALPVARRLAMGAPAAEICRIAAEEGADMIVMGTHGRTGVMRLLMGSIAESVLRHAPCPVLVYRETARKPAAASVANG